MTNRVLRSSSSTVGNATKWTLIGLTAVVLLFPLYWGFMGSFKPQKEAIAKPPIFFPHNPVGLENYREVLGRVPMLLYYRNSLVVAGAVTLSCLFTCSLVGYIFAKFDFFAKRLLFIIILATMMIPFEVLLIPIYIIFRDLKLLDTLWALMIPGLVSAFGIFLMRQFMKTIPTDLIEAARIDGCSEFGIFWRVVMPLCKPALSALAIFTFLASWDNFLWPLIVLQGAKKLTVPIGVMMFSEWMIWNNYPHLVMACAVMAMLPMLIVFVLAQRQFIEGIAMTGLKG